MIVAIYLAVLAAYDIGAGSTTTLYYGTKGFTTGPADSPANQWFAPRIKQAPGMARSAFAQGASGGRTRTDRGTLVLSNEDGGLDDLIDYALDGRAITIWRGEETGTFPTDFEEVVVATMEQPLIDSGEVRIELRGRHFEVDVPIQSTLYAGTGTLEGDESLKGKPKPLLYGKVRNFSPPLVNPAKLIYQLHDGAVQSVEGVYDSGIMLRSLDAWTARTSNVSDDLYFVRHGDGDFVAGGKAGALTTSTDGGATWTSQSTGFSSNAIHDGAYFESVDLWIIVGAGNRIETAAGSDLTTWTNRTSPFTAGAVIVRVFAAGDTAVAIADNGEIAYTSNGTSWTKVTTTPFTITAASLDRGALTFARNQWIAALSDGTTLEVATSGDGQTWTLGETALSQTADVHDVVSGRGLLLMVGTQLATSVDGANWVRVYDALGPGTDFRMRRVTYDDALGKFIGVGYLDGGGSPLHRIFHSPDGLRWVAFDPGLAGKVDGFFQTGGVATDGSGGVVAVGEDDFVGGTGSRAYTNDAAGTYASQADLLDDDLQPEPGTYKLYAAGGYIRLGSPPVGQVTVDATQGATAADRTAAALFRGVLDQVGLDVYTNVQDEDDLTAWTDLFGGITVTGGQSDPIGGTDAYTVACATGIFEALDYEIAFTGNGVKSVIVAVKEKVAPTSSPTVLMIFDSVTSGTVWRIDIDSWTDGQPNYTEDTGTVERLEDLGGGWWAFYVKTVSVTAANGHTIRVIPDQAGTESGSIDVYRIRCYDAVDPLAEDYYWLDALRLDADDDAVLGLWTGTEPTQASAALERIAKTPGAWWGVDRKGYFRIRQLKDPSSGTSELTIDEAGPNGIFRGTFRRLREPLPIWRQVVRFSQNHTVQASGLVAGVSDTRRALLAQAWKEESDEDATVQTKHLLAREDVVETLYAESADADAEATRQLTLRKVIRDLLQSEVPLNDDTVALDLGSIVTVQHSRFGLSAGKKHVVLGVEPNTAQGRLRLTVWA